MNTQKGYYSVIQYCPDRSRFEAVNVGVLLFCPESHFLAARTSSQSERIKRFFGREQHDFKRILSYRQGFVERLQKERSAIRSLDDLQQFIAMRANCLQLTNPRPMKVSDPEKDLNDLFQLMVGEQPKGEPRRSLKTRLAQEFSAAGLQSLVLSDVKVCVPVLNKQIEIPFGFQNGRFNLIHPVRFGAANSQHSITTACKYAVEGRSIYEHRDPEWGEMQLVVVGEFRSSDDEGAAVVRRVFDENKVKLFRMEEVSQLIDEIRRTGKIIQQSV